MGVLLTTRSLTKVFGGLAALRDVSLEVGESEIFVIIGPNGSGKTTFFNVVTGVIPPSGGKTFMNGQDITGLPSHLVVRRGISRTFQTIRLFRSMSVMDNVLTGRHVRGGSGVLPSVWRTAKYRTQDARDREVAEDALRFCGLWDERDRLGVELPYGKQRRLEIARAIATEPSIVLLDEPAAGMNPSEVDDLIELIRAIKERKIAVLLIEHQMRLAMKVAERMAVFESGTKIAEGSPEEIRGDQRVIEAYLGTESQ